MEDKDQFRQEVQKVFDAAKQTAQDKLLFTYNGILYPSVLCSSETFQAMDSFEARETDIVMAAYPKCGSNWTFLLIKSMLKMVYNKVTGQKIPILEFGAPDKFEELNQESSPRAIATHFPYDNIPSTFFEKKVKILVVIRNPKDTAVSLFHFYNNNPMLPNYSSWDKYFTDFISGKGVFYTSNELRLGMLSLEPRTTQEDLVNDLKAAGAIVTKKTIVCWGSYFDHALQWNNHIDDGSIFIITFEEMKQDLQTAVKKISDFFGFSLTEEQVQEISERGTFKSMKEKSNETHGDFGQVLFRKGEIGDWKNHFSEDQSKEMDAQFEQYLAGTKIGNMMNYYEYCKF